MDPSIDKMLKLAITIEIASVIIDKKYKIKIIILSN